MAILIFYEYVKKSLFLKNNTAIINRINEKTNEDQNGNKSIPSFEARTYRIVSEISSNFGNILYKMSITVPAVESANNPLINPVPLNTA